VTHEPIFPGAIRFETSEPKTPTSWLGSVIILWFVFSIVSFLICWIMIMEPGGVDRAQICDFNEETPAEIILSVVTFPARQTMCFLSWDFNTATNDNPYMKGK